MVGLSRKLNFKRKGNKLGVSNVHQMLIFLLHQKLVELFIIAIILQCVKIRRTYRKIYKMFKGELKLQFWAEHKYIKGKVEVKIPIKIEN